MGGKIPEIPYAISQWRKHHPDTDPPDQLVVSQKLVHGVKADTRHRMVYFQDRAERARRTLHGVDQQLTKAANAVAGKAPVKRNRFITLTRARPSINRELETRSETDTRGIVD